MSKTPLRLRPAIAQAAQARSKQLRQTVSGYVAILVNNHEEAPVALEAQGADEKLARVNVGMSWRSDLRKRTARLAREAKLSINAFVEALIAADLLSPDQDLVIRGRGSKPKLR